MCKNGIYLKFKIWEIIKFDCYKKPINLGFIPNNVIVNKNDQIVHLLTVIKF